jgi:hypothetical protein
MGYNSLRMKFLSIQEVEEDEDTSRLIPNSTGIHSFHNARTNPEKST